MVNGNAIKQYKTHTVLVVGSAVDSHHCRDPVVGHRLVSSEDEGVSLCDVDVERVDGNGVVYDTISLHDLDGVILNTTLELSKAGHVDHSETVTKTTLDVDDSPGGFWSTVEATNTVEETSIWGGLETSTVIGGEVSCLEGNGEVVVPVVDAQDGGRIVDIWTTASDFLE